MPMALHTCRVNQSTENESAVAARRGAMEMVNGVKMGAPMTRLLKLSIHRRIAIGTTPFNMLRGGLDCVLRMVVRVS